MNSQYDRFLLSLLVFLISLVIVLPVKAYEVSFSEPEKRLKNQSFSSNKDIQETSFQGIEKGYEQKFGSAADGFKDKGMNEFGGFRKVRTLDEKRFGKQTREDNKKYLKQMMDEVALLSESEKRFLINYFDKYHAGHADLTNGNDSADVQAFMRIAHDTSISLRSRKDALEDYFSQKR